MIGFIGMGNMATAIIRGMLSRGNRENKVYAYDRNTNKVESLSDVGIIPCVSMKEVIINSKYIFLAVKPNAYDSVLREISQDIDVNKIIITMAAGYEISRVKSLIGPCKVVRTMPNTPALVGRGFTAVSFDDLIEDDEKSLILDMLGTFGYTHEVKEEAINAYSAISGSGPAFIFILMEAMADAAVLLGIPRPDAYKVVEATVLGSAGLALETKRHPGELKDMVCSPGGTTIEGVRTLEGMGFRSAIMEGIINTYKKNLDITKIR